MKDEPRGATKRCPSCAEMIQADAKVCRYCGKRFGPRYGRWALAGVGLALLATVLVAWHAGKFDYALYKVSLNWNTCAENPFGKALCGSDLEAYCRDRAAGVQVSACDQIGVESLAAKQQRREEVQQEVEEAEINRSVKAHIARGKANLKKVCDEGGELISDGSMTLAGIRERYDVSIDMQGLFSISQNDSLRAYQEKPGYGYLQVPLPAGTVVILPCN